MRTEPPPSISDPEAECSRGLIKNRARRYERRCFRRRQAGAPQAAIGALRLVICWGFMALSCSICLPGHALGGELVLYGAGRATAVAMFTRNTLCAVALPGVELTTANLLDRLLDPAVKLGTSTPKADPAGDYT
jgi:hypothetical protein